MIKQKLLNLSPFFLLSGCGQATYKNASLPVEERAVLLQQERDPAEEGCGSCWHGGLLIK